MTKIYTVKYEGAVEIEAENEDEAEELAWLNEGVSSEDIISIT